MLHTEMMRLVSSVGKIRRAIKKEAFAGRGMVQSASSGRHIISYHYPCPDGVFAALAAAEHFKEEGLFGVQYYPNKVFAPRTLDELDLTANDTLYLLDYIGPPGFARAACKQAGRVILLDHHKTAFEEFEDCANTPQNLEINLEMQLSGATIALKYFRPKINERQDRLFRYIEDADLWKWQLDESKYFHAGFASLNLELDVNKNQHIFDQLLALEPHEVVAKGKLVQAEIDERIAKALTQALVIQLCGEEGKAKGYGQCLVIQANDDSSLGRIRSQLGNVLAEASRAKGLRAVGMIAYREPEMAEGLVKCSLRSIGSEDTTLVSKAHGGGGHLNASSFIIDKAEFSQWFI